MAGIERWIPSAEMFNGVVHGISNVTFCANKVNVVKKLDIASNIMALYSLVRNKLLIIVQICKIDCNVH